MPFREPPQPSVVVFDLGGVLIDWDPRHLYRKLIADEATMEWFLREVCSPEWNAEQDAGRSWADAVAEATERYPAEAELIQAYIGRWSEMIAGDIPESVAVLRSLAERGVPLYALTNWSAETFPYARDRFAWLGLFRDIVVSGEVGLKKPDPAIFNLMADRIGVEPLRALFVDDSAANVATGHSLGFQALHFTSAAVLADDARVRALLGAADAA